MTGDRARVKRTPWAAAAALLCAALIVPPRLSSAAPQSGDGLVAAATSPPASASAPRVLAQVTIPRTAAWPFFKLHRKPVYDSLPHAVTPHPAVARIIVPEGRATAFGTGTLIDVRDQYALVVTNWHVVRDSRGVVEVVFPSGFRSNARPLKVDSNWDLAALVIWRPPIEPVKIATLPPRPGDFLTIHGYGRGQYRIATGHCTTYYSPHPNFPHEMVELDVEARQGDSGGPIFNQSGELAGVLFGAGQGTTLGSFAPRVSNFLATLAPDIGQAKDQAQVAVADRPAPNIDPKHDGYANGSDWKYPSAPWSPAGAVAQDKPASADCPNGVCPHLASAPRTESATTGEPISWSDLTKNGWYEPLESALAVVGVLALSMQFIKLIR